MHTHIYAFWSHIIHLDLSGILKIISSHTQALLKLEFGYIDIIDESLHIDYTTDLILYWLLKPAALGEHILSHLKMSEDDICYFST